MALARKPGLVILDEPSAGLSPESVDKLFTILSSAKDDLNISVILIEQNVSKAFAYADRVYRIKDGSLSLMNCRSMHNIDELFF